MAKYTSPHLRLHGNPGLKKTEKAEPAKPAAKAKPMPKDEPEGKHAGAVEHVTKTHPGETQPHPSTGVHAVHTHHTGGSMHNVHIHHDGGQVESHEGKSADEAQQMHAEALPAEGPGEQEPDGDEMAAMPSAMSSLGGEEG